MDIFLVRIALHEMWSILINDPVAWCVFQSAKPAAWIKVLLGVENLGDPMHIVLDSGPSPPW